MNRVLSWLTNTPMTGPNPRYCMRLMDGGEFLLGRSPRKLYMQIRELGASRSWGYPFPHFTADFVAGLEIYWRLAVAFGSVYAADCNPVRHGNDRRNPVDKNRATETSAHHLYALPPVLT